MEKYRKKYRVIAEFDQDGNILKNLDGKISRGGEFVYCNNGNIAICRYDNSHLRIDINGSGRFNDRLRKLNSKGYKLKSYPLSEGGWIIIEEKNTATIFKICNAKRQRKTPVGLHNIKNNYPYFERMQNKFEN